MNGLPPKGEKKKKKVSFKDGPPPSTAHRQPTKRGSASAPEKKAGEKSAFEKGLRNNLKLQRFVIKIQGMLLGPGVSESVLKRSVRR